MKEIAMHTLRRSALMALFGFVGLVAAPLAQNSNDETKKIQDSITILNALTSAPDDGIPRDLLSKAEAIVVIPSLVKGGFVVGAKHGTGLISARDRESGQWSGPAFVKMTGGSIGWQIGVESVDLVLLVMNRDGIDKLLDDKFTVGGSLSVAGGPVGRSGDAATDAKVAAQILAYSRAKGLFAGATFEGAALHNDDDANQRFYGSKLSVREIVLAPPRPNMTPAGTAWNDTLRRLAAR